MERLSLSPEDLADIAKVNHYNCVKGGKACAARWFLIRMESLFGCNTLAT
jgi:hypothetical protein